MILTENMSLSVHLYKDLTTSLVVKCRTSHHSVPLDCLLFVSISTTSCPWLCTKICTVSIIPENFNLQNYCSQNISNCNCFMHKGEVLTPEISLNLSIIFFWLEFPVLNAKHILSVLFKYITVTVLALLCLANCRIKHHQQQRAIGRRKTVARSQNSKMPVVAGRYLTHF